LKNIFTEKGSNYEKEEEQEFVNSEAEDITSFFAKKDYTSEG
tara:strand:- start:225 stop:350 length:126 start_codon:yes stop_codon:yes gene_type:complete